MKTLVKYHPFAIFARDVPTNTWSLEGDFKMIPGITGVGYGLAFHETYFDLAGMSMEEKTLFFEAADVQQTYLPTWTGVSAPGDKVLIYDIMSSVPIDMSTVLPSLSVGFGFPASLQTFNEIIYNRIEQYVTTQDVGQYGSPILVNSQNTSSGSPSASDRIYSYRIVSVELTDPASPVTRAVISPARHILSTTAKEEADHVYMMRLLRSYQLQQEPDED